MSKISKHQEFKLRRLFDRICTLDVEIDGDDLSETSAHFDGSHSKIEDILEVNDTEHESTMPALTINIGKEGKVRLKSTIYAKEKNEKVDDRKMVGATPIKFKEKYSYPFSSDLINHDLESFEIPFPQRPYYQDLVLKVHEKEDEEEDKDIDKGGSEDYGEIQKLHDYLDHSSRSILHEREEKAFKEWLDEIYLHYKREELNHFEHNLNVWRELWRAIEISKIAVITADVRNPLLFIPKVLYLYLVNLMPVVIALTKCDLIPKDIAYKWRREIQFRFPRARVICIATKPYIGDEDKISKRKKLLHGKSRDSTSDVNADRLLHICRNECIKFYKYDSSDDFQLKICLIGQPNGGKSSIVNALMGEKRVSVSRIAGHTKHFQTLLLPEGIVCDSPGLLFPSVIVPQAVQELFGLNLKNLNISHIFSSGIFPFPQIRETLSSIRIVATHFDLISQLKLEHPDGARIARKKKESKYKSDITKVSKAEDIMWTPWDICDSYANKRGYFIKGSGRSDTHRAGLELLRDTLDGVIPFYVIPSSSLMSEEVKRSIDDRLKEDDAGISDIFPAYESLTFLSEEEEEEKGKNEEDEEVEEEDKSGKPNKENKSNLFSLLEVDDDDDEDNDI